MGYLNTTKKKTTGYSPVDLSLHIVKSIIPLGNISLSNLTKVPAVIH
jgi:hypothetical protein